MAHLKNISNEYAAQLEGLFDRIPKAVLAAIAVSALTEGGERLDRAKSEVAAEWETLYRNGIVPQKPCKEARLAMETDQ